METKEEGCVGLTVEQTRTQDIVQSKYDVAIVSVLGDESIACINHCTKEEEIEKVTDYYDNMGTGLCYAIDIKNPTEIRVYTEKDVHSKLIQRLFDRYLK